MAATQAMPLMASVKKARKPNLLFVFTDQQSFDMIGAVNPQVKTPVLDGLLKKGVRFNQCISNQPVCTPMRGMLLTGQHPLYGGAFKNDTPLLPDEGNRLGHVFSKAGYETAYIGKWHLLGGRDRDRGVPPGENRHGFDETFLSNNCHVNFRPSGCYYWNDAGTERIFFKDEYPDRPWELEAQTRQVEEWFDQRDRSRPFATFVSWHPPHDYSGDGCEKIEGRQYNYDVDELDPDLITPYINTEIRLRPGTSETDEMSACRKKQYKNYMAMITACDAALGRLVDKLKKQGVYEDTLIVFTSDHGDMLGSHESTTTKQTPHDYSCRVPMFMTGPVGLQPGRVSELLMGSMDLMPTLLGLLDLKIPSTVQGRDLSSAIQSGNDDAVTSVPLFMLYNSTPWRGVYTKDWTYAYSLNPNLNRIQGGALADVLFDHQKDPHQLINLFEDPDMVSKQVELHQLTHRWMEKFNDHGYSMADFHKAAGDHAWWQENYSERPIDLLNKNKSTA
jgi:arylsulfatase A-like enzyme